MRRTVAVVGMVAVFGAGLAVGSRSGPDEPAPGGSHARPVALGDDLELVGALTSFEDCDGFLAHVQERAHDLVTPYGLGGGPALPLDATVAREDAMAGDGAGAADEAAGPVTDTAAAPTAGTSPEDVSGTNVQERGVDEPDRVKTDGEHLYAVTGDRLRIVDIRQDQPVELATVPLGDAGWGAELLLAGDRLLVTSSGGAFVPFAGERRAGSVLPGGTATTTLTAIDVADPSAPEVVERLTLDGATVTARMVDQVARVVIRTAPGTNLPWEQPEASGLRAERAALAANQRLVADSTATDWLPYYVHETAAGDRHEGTLVACERVAVPADGDGLGTLSVLTVDVADGALRPDAGTVAVLGSGDHVYASAERLYVATPRWSPTGAGAGGADVARPGGPLPGGATATELHAFAIDDPHATEYLASGTVEGSLLNQWALSEHEGVLRVASTLGDPWSPASSESAVTTLAVDGDELVELGRVEGLGPTETIHAVRFAGPVGYVVTFRRTDPLYTIDLSEPAAPAVVGELKIPGYSAYLHPVGDGRLLGVGQDADEQGVTRGVQVSAFDVSDPADPRRTDTVTVPGSTSPVEWDHRAFLHWPATGLTVVPVVRTLWDGPDGATSRSPLAGALALVPDGGTLAGAAGHPPEEVVLSHADLVDGDPMPTDELEDLAGRAHPVGATVPIDRAIVSGDRLLTLSEVGLVVHDLTTLADRGALIF